MARDLLKLRERTYKRPFDLLIMVAVHVLLAPIWLVLWTLLPLLIWLEDRGPIFYRQERMGKNRAIFNVRKFRTMVPQADKLGPAWTTTSDLRITKVGRLLRKVALDELPQTLAIWKGDMSLVGPRPLAVKEQEHLEEKIPGFAERLVVRPGLAGLAQIYNRSDEPEPKLHFDLQYVNRMSIWLDLKILTLAVLTTVSARWDARGGKAKQGSKAPHSAPETTTTVQPR